MAPSGPPAAKAKAAAKPEAKAKAKPEKKDKKSEEPRPEDLIAKVAKPDPKEFEERIEKVNAEIEAIQKKKEGLSGKINEQSGGKDEYASQRGALRAEADKWSALIDEAKAQKDGISKQMGDKRQESQDMKAQLGKMKKAIGFTSESEIDERIAAIEYKMHTESVSLKIEKDYLKEISELKKNRPKVAQVNSMEANIKGVDPSSSLKEQSKGLSEKMNEYFDARRKITEKIKELNEERAKQTGNLPELITQRDEFGKQVGEKIKERNMIKAEKREAEQKFYAYEGELRKIRQERAGKEREERNKEYEDRRRVRDAEKLDEQPHVQEITLIEQTMLFCKSFTATKGGEQKEEKKEIVHTNKDDEMVLLKKEDRDAEFYYAPTKVKKGKQAKGAKEGGAAKAKPIKHNAETFQLFDKLKLDPPLSTDDVPALLEKLDEKMAFYKQKVEAWEQKRDAMKKKILEGGAISDDEKAEEEKPAEETKEEE